MEVNQYCYKYPRPSVTTDCVIFGFDAMGLSILLIERGVDPFKGKWALPGGFLRMDEDADAGAKRELKEETGLQVNFIRQLGAFTEVDRDPRGRVITIAYYALVKKSEVCGGDDAVAARWFPVGEIPPLAFDHESIIRLAFNTLREQIHFRPIGFELLPAQFTMSQLQTLYESVLGVKFDRRNFANKMLKLGILNACENAVKRKAGRTPIMYSFNMKKYACLKANGFRLEF